MKRIAIGLDIGDGESSARWIRLLTEDGTLDPNSRIEELYVENNAYTTPTCFVYDINDQVVYGRPAYQVDRITPAISALNIQKGEMDSDAEKQNIENVLHGRTLITRFKKSPVIWGKTDRVSRKSYRTLMGDYISALFKAIRSLNEQLTHIGDDEITIFVGCPSSAKWSDEKNRTQYEKLIAEATGIDDVHVVPESTAAVFSALKNIGHLDPWKGISVYDSGSSTFDHTYMQIGKAKLECSWDLGASAIEALIREKAFLEEIGRDGMYNVWPQNTREQEMMVRETIKEAYFGTRANPGFGPSAITASIKYIKSDDQGRIVIENKRGRLIPKTDTLTPVIDGSFMNEVLNNEIVPEVREGIVSLPQKSWADHCRAFFLRNKELIEENQLPCGTIILTGGGSNMGFITDICKDVFPDAEIIIDEFPSYCVASGLCQVARNSYAMGPLLEQQKSRLPELEETLKTKYRDELTENFKELFYNAALVVFSGVTEDIIIRDLRDKINQEIEKQINSDEFTEKVKAVRQHHQQNCAKEIAGLCQDAANIMYDPDISKRLELNSDLFSTEGADKIMVINPAGIIEIPTIMNTIQNILANLLGFVVALAIGVVLSEIPVIGPAIGALAGWAVAAWIKNHDTYKVRLVYLNRALGKWKNNPDKFKKLFSDTASQAAVSIVEDEYGEGKPSLGAVLEASLQDAMKIITLVKFEKNVN